MHKRRHKRRSEGAWRLDAPYRGFYEIFRSKPSYLSDKLVSRPDRPGEKSAVFEIQHVEHGRPKGIFRSTLTPPDWLEPLLGEFDRDGFKFTGSLTLLRLGNLFENMQNDLEKIKAGADTYNNINYDGSVQSSTNDWTRIYNPIIYPELMKTNSGFDNPPEFAYGEKSTSRLWTPIFNPLHPVTRGNIAEYLYELAGKYSGHSSFKGLAVNFWHGTILWFGSLKTGYDDYSIGLFESERKIDLGIAKDAPDRFQRRYETIMSRCKDEFITWRCEKIGAFLLECRDILTKHRKDLILTLTVWNEPSAWGYYYEVPETERQLGGSSHRSNYELYREFGLDLKMFEDAPNIEISVENNSLRDRSAIEGANAAPEKCHMYSDFAFLDGETQNVLEKASDSSGFIFNCWVEAWGNHKFFECEKDDLNLKEIHALPDYDAICVFRENSSYDDDPDKKFWFDSQLRITAPLPSEPYFSEWLVNELAVHDALSITEGGLYLDKAHSEPQLKFAREYRKLPKVKFNRVKDANDPVCARYLPLNGKTYVYAVNREPYAIRAALDIGGKREEITLGAFQIAVREIDCETSDVSCSAFIDEERQKFYENKCKSAFAHIAEKDKNGEQVPGCEAMISRIKQALANHEYAFIRHALASYPIEKALSL